MSKLKSHGRYYSLTEFEQMPEGYVAVYKFSASDKFKIRFYDKNTNLLEEQKYVPRTSEGHHEKLQFREFLHVGGETYMVAEKEENSTKSIYLGEINFEKREIGDLMNLADIDRKKESFWRISHQRRFYISFLENDWSTRLNTFILSYSEEIGKYDAYVQIYTKELELLDAYKMKIKPRVHADILGAFWLKPGIPLIALRLHDGHETVRLYWAESDRKTRYVDLDLGEVHINDFELTSNGTDIFLAGFHTHKTSDLIKDFRWNYPSDSYHRPISVHSDGIFMLRYNLRKRKVLAKGVYYFDEIKGKEFNHTSHKDLRTDNLHFFPSGHLVFTGRRANLSQKGTDLLRNIYDLYLVSFTDKGKLVDTKAAPLVHRSSDLSENIIGYKTVVQKDRLYLWTNAHYNTLNELPQLEHLNVHFNYQGNTRNDLICLEYDYKSGKLLSKGSIGKLKKSTRVSPYFFRSDGKHIVAPGLKVFKSNAVRIVNPFY